MVEPFLSFTIKTRTSGLFDKNMNAITEVYHLLIITWFSSLEIKLANVLAQSCCTSSFCTLDKVIHILVQPLQSIISININVDNFWNIY